MQHSVRVEVAEPRRCFLSWWRLDAGGLLREKGDAVGCARGRKESECETERWLDWRDWVARSARWLGIAAADVGGSVVVRWSSPKNRGNKAVVFCGIFG